MGYDTTVIFNNDALEVLLDDPKFANNLYNAILKRSLVCDSVYVSGKSGNITFNTVATVVETHDGNLSTMIDIVNSNGDTIYSYHRK